MDMPAAAAGSWRLGARTVRRMGLGTMRLTAPQDHDRALAVVRRALALGVDHLDTAAFYLSPGGLLGDTGGPLRYATEIVREALAGVEPRPVVVTKVGPGIGPDGLYQATPDQLRAQVEENLRRLGVDRLDVVNLRIIKKPGADSVAARFEALAALREEGLIGDLGLSNVRLDHVEEAERIAPVVCVQNAYAVDLNRRDDPLVEACRMRGIAFVPFFAIASSGRERGLPAGEPDAVREVAARYDASPHQVRLAWTLHRGPHVLAIPGTSDPAHVEANVAAAALRLDADDLAMLDPLGG